MQILTFIFYYFFSENYIFTKQGSKPPPPPFHTTPDDQLSTDHLSHEEKGRKHEYSMNLKSFS